ARRIDKAGHAFSRVDVDDIVAEVKAHRRRIEMAVTPLQMATSITAVHERWFK
ncbi:hypothetical protein LCGC14_1968990, partial [marine sediment metagenome]